MMLYFIGFMGVGKTTIGKEFALKHNIKFIDTDKKISEKSKKTISDIFQSKGETYFRKLESQILKEISQDTIVACGGGLPAYHNNMSYIKKSGVSIYLQASTNEIFNRLTNDLKKRPLIKHKSNDDLKKFIAETIAKREKFYLMADYTINTNNISKKDVLRKINTLPLPF